MKRRRRMDHIKQSWLLPNSLITWGWTTWTGCLCYIWNYTVFMYLFFHFLSPPLSLLCLVAGVERWVDGLLGYHAEALKSKEDFNYWRACLKYSLQWRNVGLWSLNFEWILFLERWFEQQLLRSSSWPYLSLQWCYFLKKINLICQNTATKQHLVCRFSWLF